MSTIKEFKAVFAGGGARPNQFRVLGGFPTGTLGVGDNKRISFLAKGSAIPPANVGEIALPYRGRQLFLAGDRTFDPWTITIYNDENFELRSAFESWQNKINSLEGNVSANLVTDYFQDWKVEQLSRNGKVIATYEIIDCFPQNVAEIPLSFEATDQVEEFSVTMRYQYWRRAGVTT